VRRGVSRRSSCALGPLCSDLQHAALPLLQVHREPRRVQAGAQGARPQEDPAGHRGLPDLQGQGQAPAGRQSRRCVARAVGGAAGRSTLFLSSDLQLRATPLPAHVVGEGGGQVAPRRLRLSDRQVQVEPVAGVGGQRPAAAPARRLPGGRGAGAGPSGAPAPASSARRRRLSLRLCAILSPICICTQLLLDYLEMLIISVG